MTLSRTPKPRKCAWCSERFHPRQMGQKVCSPKCALAHTRAEAAKAHRSPRKPGAGKPPADRRTALRQCQKAFNAYIRERDRNQPCITCGTHAPGGDPRGGVWDCGHYLTVGAHPELRFNDFNAHKQCKRCNRDESGAQQRYRAALIERIGREVVEWLEGPHPPAKYTVDDLNALAADYRRETRRLKKDAA